MRLDWYKDNNCSHAHCPLGCEKPQPEVCGGKLLCMKCLVLYDTLTEMVPCTPEICEDEP